MELKSHYANIATDFACHDAEASFLLLKHYLPSPLNLQLQIKV